MLGARWGSRGLVLAILLVAALAGDGERDTVRLIEIDGPGAGRYTNVKIGRDGLPLMVYNSEADGGQVRAAHCQDPLCDSVSLMLAVGPPDSSEDPIDGRRFIDMAMGQDGLPLMAFTDVLRRPPRGRTQMVACLDEICREKQVATLADGRSAYPYVAWTPRDGIPIVAFYHADRGLVISLCQDQHCESGSAEFKVDPDPKAGRYPSLAVVDVVRGTAKLVVAYVGGGAHQLTVALCELGLGDASFWRDIKNANKQFGIIKNDGNVEGAENGEMLMDGVRDLRKNGGGLGQLECVRKVVDASTTGVGYVSMRLGSDGLPVIMYFDEAAGLLKVLHCDDLECSEGSTEITAADFVGLQPYGEFPELDVDPATGLAVMTYFNQTDNTSGALKIAKCTDIKCTDVNVSVVATGGCGFGRDSSIAFGPQGTMYISFLAYSGGSNQNGDRKHAMLAVLPAAGDLGQQLDGKGWRSEQLLKSQGIGNSAMFKRRIGKFEKTGTGHSMDWILLKEERQMGKLDSDGDVRRIEGSSAKFGFEMARDGFRELGVGVDICEFPNLATSS